MCSIITAAIRPSLPLSPMFHVKAHQVGSGKSYLCRIITLFSTAQNGTPSTFPKDEEECRKFLLAELLRSPAVIEFDNLTGDLVPHKSLCVVLTSENLTDRILGISKTATVSTRTLFLSSGNNVSPIGDMTRRCITINLDPACETPATREFERPNLAKEIQASRERYVSEALTIVAAWIEAGRPMSLCKPLAGFEEWSYFCRQSLLWLGCSDPIESVLEAMKDDPDRETLGRLLESWYSCFGNKPTMVREAIKHSGFQEISKDRESLGEVLQDIAWERTEINRHVLGKWMKRNCGRIVNGFRLNRASGNRSSVAWVVEKVKGDGETTE